MRESETCSFHCRACEQGGRDRATKEETEEKSLRRLRGEEPENPGVIRVFLLLKDKSHQRHSKQCLILNSKVRTTPYVSEDL